MTNQPDPPTEKCYECRANSTRFIRTEHPIADAVAVCEYCDDPLCELHNREHDQDVCELIAGSSVGSFRKFNHYTPEQWGKIARRIDLAQDQRRNREGD